MSASDTNIAKQKKRHVGPLVGIAAALGFAAVLFFGFLLWTAYLADNPNAESPVTILAD